MNVKREILERGGWTISILLFSFIVNGCYIGVTTFSGRFLNAENGFPIKDAEFFFLNKITYTDENGYFFFNSIPYRFITFFIKVPFYKDKRKNTV